jgi:hypothetical protein
MQPSGSVPERVGKFVRDTGAEGPGQDYLWVYEPADQPEQNDRGPAVAISNPDHTLPLARVQTWTVSESPWTDEFVESGYAEVAKLETGTRLKEMYGQRVRLIDALLALAEKAMEKVSTNVESTASIATALQEFEPDEYNVRLLIEERRDSSETPRNLTVVIKEYDFGGHVASVTRVDRYDEIETEDSTVRVHRGDAVEEFDNARITGVTPPGGGE